MGAAIGQVLSLGVGVALSPVPIIAVVLMLGTPRARANGPAFVLGWVVGLALVGTLVLLAASGADASEGGEPATWVDVLELVLGCLLALVAVKQWRGRPHEGEEAALPEVDAGDRHVRAGQGARDGRSALRGQSEEPAPDGRCRAAIAQTGADTGSQAVALAVFVVIGTLGPGLPVAIYFALGARAERVLGELKRGWRPTTRRSWPCSAWYRGEARSGTGSPAFRDVRTPPARIARITQAG